MFTKGHQQGIGKGWQTSESNSESRYQPQNNINDMPNLIQSPSLGAIRRTHQGYLPDSNPQPPPRYTSTDDLSRMLPPVFEDNSSYSNHVDKNLQSASHTKPPSAPQPPNYNRNSTNYSFGPDGNFSRDDNGPSNPGDGGHFPSNTGGGGGGSAGGGASPD